MFGIIRAKVLTVRQVSERFETREKHQPGLLGVEHLRLLSNAGNQFFQLMVQWKPFE